MTVLSKVCFRRIEIQACPPTPRHFELYQRFEILQAGRAHGADAYARGDSLVQLGVFSAKKKKEKRKREGKKKVNDSLLCSTSFIRLDYIEHHPRGTRPFSLYALAFLLPLFQPSSSPLPLSLPCLPRFPGFFPSSFFLSFPQASFYTSLDACTHLHTAISLYRAYANVYAFQHARTRAYN